MDAELLRVCEQLSTTVGAAIAAKPLLEKLLGPSFEYVGDAMADLFARVGNKNVLDILRRAALRLDDNSRRSGFINPRVLRLILEDGCYVDDEVAKEYYAGLFVSAFTNELDDDRAITLLSVVRNLTTRQIRAHHLLYSLTRYLYVGRNHKFGVGAVANTDIFIPGYLVKDEIFVASHHDAQHVAYGLVHEDLIDREYDLQRSHFDASSDKFYTGWRMKGTPFGAELFLWVHAVREAVADDIFNNDANLNDWQADRPLPVGVADAAMMTEYDAALAAMKNVHIVLAHYDFGQADDIGIVTALRRLSEHTGVLPRRTQRWLKSYDKIDFKRTETIEFIRRQLDQCNDSMTGSGSDRGEPGA